MNSDNEHVPGQWAVFPKAPGEYEYLKDHVMTASKPHIRICNVHGGLESPRGLANARLIAAAPEMLSILEELVSQPLYALEHTGPLSHIIRQAEILIWSIKDDATLPQN